MKRPVRFCGICGRRVSLNSHTLDWRIAYCAEHAADVKAGDTSHDEAPPIHPPTVKG